MRSLTEMPSQPFPDRNLPAFNVCTGDAILSAAGRSLAPVPRIDLTTVRRSNDTLKRLATWLCEEACSEAEFRRDGFNGQMFRAMKPTALPQQTLSATRRETMCPLDVVVNGSRLDPGQADRPLATYP